MIGLPFAVVVGWALGTPVARTVAAQEAGGIGGSDALGGAPITADASTGGYASHPPRPNGPVTTTGPTPSPIVVISSRVITKTVTVPGSPLPVTATTSAPPPVVIEPPVPTPTQITGPPEPIPTDSESAEPSFDPEPPVDDDEPRRSWRRFR
ncbi:hypothetical protein [Actinoplanes awajinensis]|uniref:hypothetical protein n=1 Tax=Actinoplanes awajinensis TaxID=135946 RepID=UPI0012F9F309|nr:hypothetical protein [Actinoplanes awajinensis]